MLETYSSNVLSGKFKHSARQTQLLIAGVNLTLTPVFDVNLGPRPLGDSLKENAEKPHIVFTK